METLSLSLTKDQYQGFIMLLERLEYMRRAADYQKFKAHYGLESKTNYLGCSVALWKFARDCVLEVEVRRRLTNWSWENIKSHRAKCKDYRAKYKEKLLSKDKPSKELLAEVRRCSEYSSFA